MLFRILSRNASDRVWLLGGRCNVITSILKIPSPFDCYKCLRMHTTLLILKHLRAVTQATQKPAEKKKEGEGTKCNRVEDTYQRRVSALRIG